METRSTKHTRVEFLNEKFNGKLTPEQQWHELLDIENKCHFENVTREHLKTPKSPLKATDEELKL